MISLTPYQKQIVLYNALVEAVGVLKAKQLIEKQKLEYAVKHTREQIETRQYMPWINKRKVGQPNKVDKQESINRRNKKWQKYYGDKRWKQLREWQIRTHPLCQDCLFEGRSVPAEEVHHIISFMKYKGKEREMYAYDYSNLVSLCKACHIKRHNNETRKIDYLLDKYKD